MIRSIIDKEWCKTRRTFITALIVAVLFALYAVVRIHRLIALKGMEHLWMIALLKDNSFAGIIELVPLAAGIALGVAQMAPEMAHKRLKLTLHLPVEQNVTVVTMLAVGLAEMLIITGVQAAIIGIYDSIVMPSQLVSRIMLSALPWWVAGFAGYLFACAICLEPAWKRRVVIAPAAAAMLLMFFLEPALEAYDSFLPIMIIFTMLLAILSVGSVMRFKEGLDD